MRLTKDLIEGKRVKITLENDGEILRGVVFTRLRKPLPWRKVQDSEFPTTMTVWTPAVERRSMLLLMYKEMLLAYEEEMPMNMMAQVLSFATVDQLDPMFDTVEKDKT